MASYLHPGVFVEELQAAPTIQGVPTSVPLIVGVTDRIYDLTDPTKVVTPSETPTLVTSWSEYVSLFGGRIWYGFASLTVYEFFVESNGQGQCYVYKVPQADASFATPGTSSKIQGIYAASGGSWANSIGIILTTSDGQTTDLTGYGSLVTLNVAVKRSDFPNTAPLPYPVDKSLLGRYIYQNSFRSVLVPVDDKAPPVEWIVLESFTGFWPDNTKVNQITGSMTAEMASAINSTSMFIRIKDPSTVTRQPGAKLLSKDVSMLTTSKDSPFVFPFTPDNQDKVDAVLRVPGISLLAAPEIPTLADSTGLSNVSAQMNSALQFCEKSGKLFYVIDCPLFLGVQEIINFKTGKATGNKSFGANEKAPSGLYSPLGFGAMYFPSLDIFDPKTRTRVPVLPSGPVLGRYAYTDGRVGVQKSAAGTTDGLLQSVVGLATEISDNQQNDLNPQGIDVIRKITPYGNLIWGARTIAQPGSEWTYVSVRRLFIFVEQSLLISLPWAVFERNGPQLWEAVKREIRAFLTELWNAGALAGTTQNEAFYVICDASNNTETTIEQGYLYISVGLAPTRPAEFVVIQVAQKLATPTSGS